MSAVRERPIIFSAPMVRAILAGKKTQTRRVVRWPIVSNSIAFDRELGDIVCRCDYLPPSEMLMQVRRGKQRYDVARCEGWEVECPYGAPGDTLWVREQFAMPRRTTNGGRESQLVPDHNVGGVHYLADGEAPAGYRSRPSIHMPRWASRLTLLVKSVRVERLQQISYEDMDAEGVEFDDDSVAARAFSRAEHIQIGGGSLGDTAERVGFAELWDSINGARAPWASNPWVWVVEFQITSGFTAHAQMERAS